MERILNLRKQIQFCGKGVEELISKINNSIYCNGKNQQKRVTQISLLLLSEPCLTEKCQSMKEIIRESLLYGDNSFGEQLENVDELIRIINTE